MNAYNINLIDEVVDEEVNTALELFESVPASAAIAAQSHPFGVRIFDRDAEESVSVVRFTTLDAAREYFNSKAA